MTFPERLHLGAEPGRTESKDPASEPPRIGVFICHCGRNIGSVVDVPQVVEYASKLPNVVHAEENLYSCSEDGLQSIKAAIGEHGLNRVVVASCTPRTHAPLFQSACEEVGVNKYLFELVNIRDQCSWVHMHQPELATKKARDLVRMGVARAALLEPLVDSEIEVIPVALVIGGGVTGMTAALNLANQGIDVHLVEKEKELGGVLNGVATVFPTKKRADELIGPMVTAIEEHSKITVHLDSTIDDITGYIGNFTCRVRGGEIRAGTIIVATGSDLLEPKGHYGYGTHPGIKTQLELEGMIKGGEALPNRILMIQCVGARTEEGDGKAYCSKICCMTAIKNALLIKERHRDSEVYVLFRDIMAPGAENEALYREAMEGGVMFVKFSEDDKPLVTPVDGGLRVKVLESLMKETYHLETDLVVLSTPVVPRADSGDLSRMLKVPIDADGFFLEAHAKLRPLEFATDGIFVCGSARFPVMIPDAISEACGAAAKASIPIRKGRTRGEATIAWVDEQLCVGCGTCERVCEFGAPGLAETEDGLVVSTINEILCKGCGTCAASCPSRAIILHHFSDEQVTRQIEAFGEGA